MLFDQILTNLNLRSMVANMKVNMLNKAQLLRKQVILPTLVAMAVVGGGTGYALHATSPKVTNTEHRVSSTTTTQPISTSPSSTTTLPTDDAQPATTAPVTTSPVAFPPTPEYGVDASNATVFEVFDKNAVMTDAGIPTDQQTDAESALNIIRGNVWIYKMSDDTQAFWDDICRITPPAPQDKAIVIPPITDYRDSPVIQLKFCNIHAQDKYGGWSNVLSILNNHGVFN